MSQWQDLQFDFSGARVLVTGGTSGIGAAVAGAYREAGAEVTITGTRDGPADYDEDLSGYDYQQLDVEDPAQVDALTARQRELDILVNNAGFALPSQGLDEYDPEVFSRAVHMHLIAAHRMAHGCAEVLSKSPRAGGGAIVGIASMSSYFGMGIVPGYGAAKTGLLGLTRALAVEWAPRNIRVNAVAAGLTETRMTASTFANPDWYQPTLARTPAGRLGRPGDIASAVLFLSSDAASWITGHALPVDGGYTIAG